MLLKTTVTQRNDEYLDIFPSVEQGTRVELGISDQGSWNAVWMLAQGNCPNSNSFVGLVVVAIVAESDKKHRVSETVMLDHTGEDEDKREPRWRHRLGNSGPENRREGPSRSSDFSKQNRSTSGAGAT